MTFINKFLLIKTTALKIEQKMIRVGFYSLNIYRVDFTNSFVDDVNLG